MKLAVKLLNGMHKIYPDFSRLPEAYLLLSGILEDMPNMQAQAEKCRQMAEQLKIKAAEKQQAQATARALAAAEKQNAAPTPNTPVSKRRGAPPPTKSSGLVLELVPLEPPKSE